MQYSIVVHHTNHSDQSFRSCLANILQHTKMSDCQLIVVSDSPLSDTGFYLQRLNNQFEQLGFGNHFSTIFLNEPTALGAALNQSVSNCAADKVVLVHDCDALIDNICTDWLSQLRQPFELYQGLAVSIVSADDHNILLPLYTMVDINLLQTVGGFDPQLDRAPELINHLCSTFSANGFLNAVACSRTNSVRLTSSQHNQLLKNLPKNNSDKPMFEDLVSVTEHFKWLVTEDPESVELFNEIFVNNIYKVDPAKIKNTAVIDIGANQGMFSLLCAALGSTQVLAAEPVSGTFELLKNNVKRSGFESKIACIKSAITGKQQDPVMIGLQHKSGHNSVYSPGLNSELVATQTLASLVDTCVGDNIFLKLDCEGSEYDILFDSDACVFDRIGTIAVEIHGDLHPTLKGIELFQQRLKQLGYKQMHHSQIGMWWYNNQGVAIKFEPLPITVEVWTKS